jgi:hypothetical protein
MKKIFILAGIVILLSAGTILALQYFYPDEYEKTEANADEETDSGQPLLGGDRDEHGCIGSAGYSWCESKQKCLRIWEEACTDGVNFVKSGVAAKNNPGLQKDKLYLIYEEPGKPAQSVILNFDAESLCIATDGKKTPCMALSVSDYGLSNGRKISITGIKEMDSVLVREMELGSISK